VARKLRVQILWISGTDPFLSDSDQFGDAALKAIMDGAFKKLETMCKCCKQVTLHFKREGPMKFLPPKYPDALFDCSTKKLTLLDK